MYSGHCDGVGGGEKSMAPENVLTSMLDSGSRCGLRFLAHLCLREWGNAVDVCFNSDPFPLPPSNQILSCGQPAATGSAWMDKLRRSPRPREPGHRPIPTLGTAPSLPPQARNQAARLAGPTS